MTHEEKFHLYLSALRKYVDENGHARVPASYTETREDGSLLNLGTWVVYIRQRQRSGLLKPEKAALLQEVPGWQWGPLPPGPTPDLERNGQILTLRSQGVSLQRIGDQFGLSRQRVHQIVRLSTVTPQPAQSNNEL